MIRTTYLTTMVLALALASGPVLAGSYEDSETPTGGGGGGFGIGIDLFGILKAIQGGDKAEASEPPPLAGEGPQVPPVQSMGRWQVEGVLKGGWPVVIAWSAPAGTAFEISFAVEGQPPMSQILEGNESGRGFAQFELPGNFGEAVQAGTVSFRTIRAIGGATLLEPRLLGLGCGPLAVGSVAIDEVVFEPSSVRVREGQRAFYGFHSKSDFSRATVDIARVERSGGDVRMLKVRSIEVRQSVSRNAWVGREPPLAWNGHGNDDAVSSGAHLLLVRAWAPDPGDWVIAWSPATVTVAP